MVAKKNAKHVNASQYGMKSLYSNEISNYMDAMHISQRKNAQRGGPGGYGCNAETSYALAHGDPLWRRTGHVGQEMPTLDELRKQYPSITKEKYEALLQSKPYLPKHHLRPRGEYRPQQPLGGPFNDKVENGLDLAEQER